MDPRPKIIFMGTPEVACIVLEKLIASGTYAPQLVITQPDKPAGRNQTVAAVPVKAFAQKHSIEVWQPEKLKDPATIARVKEWKPDIIIVAAYGKLIPKEILDIPPHGILNIHPSLLPLWRGPSPIQFAILMGDPLTGVSVMCIDEGMDSGPVLAQEELVIEKNDTTKTLLWKLFIKGADLLLDALPRWLEGNITPTRQNPAKATFTKLFAKEDGEIKPEYARERAERMVRALNPWPGAYIMLNGKMLKLLKVRETQCEASMPALSLSLASSPAGEKELCLYMANGCLALEMVHFEGKRPMSGYEFYLGYNNKKTAG